jgi:hypothetical protein
VRSSSAQPAICREPGAEHGPGDREARKQGESNEHQQQADADDSSANGDRRKAILDCE